MRIFYKKIIVLIAVLFISSALFFNRVRIRTIFDEWRAPKLPEPISFNDTQDESSELTRDPSASPAESAGSAQDDGSKDEIAMPPAVARDDIDMSDQDNETSPQPSPWKGEGVLSEYNLSVPFQPQAPHANWGMPYQEACEEASLIMADAFFNTRFLSKDDMDGSIKKLVDWETKTFGYYEDTTAQEVVRIAQEYFGLSASLEYNVTADNIKKHLSQNKLVLAPAAGRLLPNPYFSEDGPLYHMLVIRGYTQDGKFITNDPGTRRGEAFLYSYDDLLSAVHDWPRPHGGYKDNVTEEEMSSGASVLIVVDK